MSVRLTINESALAEFMKGPEVEAATRKAAESIADVARAKAPVDTGALRDSVVVRKSGDTIQVAAEAEYAAAVELGTLRHAAQPFMRPALDGGTL